MKKSAFFCPVETLDRVYACGRRDQVAAVSSVYPHPITADNIEEHLARLKDIEAVFSTWGMPLLTEWQLDLLPELGAVFYAGGSVQSFAAPLLDRGIVVVSAWQAMAISVAEFCQAQIHLSLKGYFRNTLDCRASSGWINAYRGTGSYGRTVAILGAGAIGRRVIEFLRDSDIRILVFDPFLSDDAARQLGVEKASLSECFRKADVVSNHLANKPETVKMLNGLLFASMLEGATFINTGRGATVDEGDLCTILGARPDLTALLDVTSSEPPEDDSPLYTRPNIHLSSHIAGSIGSDVLRMTDLCLEEFGRWDQGEPLKYAVSLEMLKAMA